MLALPLQHMHHESEEWCYCVGLAAGITCFLLPELFVTEPPRCSFPFSSLCFLHEGNFPGKLSRRFSTNCKQTLYVRYSALICMYTLMAAYVYMYASIDLLFHALIYLFIYRDKSTMKLIKFQVSESLLLERPQKQQSLAKCL